MHVHKYASCGFIAVREPGVAGASDLLDIDHVGHARGDHCGSVTDSLVVVDPSVEVNDLLVKADLLAAATPRHGHNAMAAHPRGAGATVLRWPLLQQALGLYA